MRPPTQKNAGKERRKKNLREKGRKELKLRQRKA